MIRASVCMATYNGERFLSEQINSILYQLGDWDEIVIVDDGSSDETVKFIKTIEDPRIRLFQNTRNIGACASFEKAISLSRGRFILLSDQDDIWCTGKLEKMCGALEDGNLVVASNFSHIDKSSAEIDYNTMSPLYANQSKRNIRNIVKIFLGKMQYFGSAMAFRDELKSIIIPFPDSVEAHDHFISLSGNIARSIIHLEEFLIKRRIHGNNLSTKKRMVWAKIKTRFFLLCQILIISNRLFLQKINPKQHN